MARDKGKWVMTEEDSQQVTKSRGTGRPRGGSSGIRIGEPRDTSDAPILLHPSQRFISPGASKTFTKCYVSRKILTEKPLVKEKVDPGFIQLLKDLGFSKLIGVPKIPLNNTVVREFFANLCKEHLEKGFVMVRKIKVKFSSAIINGKYELPEFEAGDANYRDALAKMVEEGRDPLEELRKEIDEITPWTLKVNNDRKEIVTAEWPEDWRVICRFFRIRIFPKDNIGHFGIEDLGFLYALSHKLIINVWKTLYEEIVSHLTNSKHLMMVP